jgi:hypothetical protein
VQEEQGSRKEADVVVVEGVFGHFAAGELGVVVHLRR